jgi:hypothetical protein
LNNLKNALSKEGYTVPGLERVNNSILPNIPQVRYYFSDQESGDAAQLVNLIQKVPGLEHVTENGPLDKTFPSLPTGVLEFWFGKN